MQQQEREKMFRRTYKYHMRPSKTVAKFLAETLETHRRLYNDALGWRMHIYETHGATFSKFDQQKAYARKRKSDPWLAKCNAQSLGLTLERLDNAYAAFFRRCKAGGKAGFPRFCPVGQFKTVSFSQNGYKITLPKEGEKWGKLSLTETVDGKHEHHLMRVKFHRPIPEGAKMKQKSVTREGSKWYLCISLEIPDGKPSCGNGRVGVDVGLKEFASLSDGTTTGDSRILERTLRKLRVANRSLSRKKNKKSNRRRKCRDKLAAIHRKVRNDRRDMHYKTAKQLVDGNKLIAVEALNVAGMMKNKRLARRIGDAGWSSFVTTLESTASRRGAAVVAVPPHNTSQQCSGCGELVPKSLSVRTHQCHQCGLELDRDVNAAKNILDRALEVKKPKKKRKTK